MSCSRTRAAASPSSSTAGMFPKICRITYQNHKQNDVDVLVGSNHDEGTFFSRPGSVNAEQFSSTREATLRRSWPTST